MAILKLKNDGDELTLNVKTAELVEGQYGEQAKFTSVDGDLLFVPADSVRRQLDRIGVVEIEDMSGKAIHFSRAKGKNSATIFWNIDPASVAHAMQSQERNGKAPIASALPQNAPKHVPGDEDDGYMASLTGGVDNSGIDFDALKSRYKECVDYVQIAWGKDTSDVALVAAAATLFIARNQQRI